MQLRACLTAAIPRLTAAHVPSPRLNAELLLMFVLNCDRAYLFAHPERDLTEDEQSTYQTVLAERVRGVPAQYITGHQEFWGMDLIVAPAVLIPRPETEHLIEAMLELRKADVGPLTSDRSLPTPDAGGQGSALRIADVGTGSGAIALALAREFPHAEIHATDTSTPALEIARANAARLQLENHIQFHQAGLLAGLNPPFDFIVSNPPYVGESEEDEVQLEVRKFEPRSAVFAGPTGLEIIARLIPQAHAALRSRGWLIMEISGTIADRARALLHDWEDIKKTNDLRGIPRVASARKPHS